MSWFPAPSDSIVSSGSASWTWTTQRQQSEFRSLKKIWLERLGCVNRQSRFKMKSTVLYTFGCVDFPFLQGALLPSCCWVVSKCGSDVSGMNSGWGDGDHWLYCHLQFVAQMTMIPKQSLGLGTLGLLWGNPAISATAMEGKHTYVHYIYLMYILRLNWGNVRYTSEYNMRYKGRETNRQKLHVIDTLLIHSYMSTLKYVYTVYMYIFICIQIYHRRDI